MRRGINRYAAIAIITVLAIILGAVTVGVWELIDKLSHPRTYSEYIKKYSEEYNIPEYIIYSVIKVESNFDPDAKSSAGAMGLMQLMPDTFLWLTSDEHLGEGLGRSMMYDPEVSIRYGVYYLNYLYKKFDYNWDTAFAAYNGGEGNVAKWLADPKYSDGNGNLTDIPFKETANYISKVNRAIDTYKQLYYNERYILEGEN